MGAWGEGPFDDDTAADWCDALDRLEPSRRTAALREALEAAAGNPGCLAYTLAVRAIAAAAIVASLQPGGPAITSPYAPHFLGVGEPLDLGDDMPGLALSALDRILGTGSEWHELRIEAGRGQAHEIARLRAALSGPPESTGQIMLF